MMYDRTKDKDAVRTLRITTGKEGGNWWRVEVKKHFIGVVGGAHSELEDAIIQARARWPEMLGKMQLEPIPQKTEFKRFRRGTTWNPNFWPWKWYLNHQGVSSPY